MAPKKKKAGGGGKKKKAAYDPEDLKSFNLAQREVLVQLLDRMQNLQETNADLRHQTKNMKEDQEHQLEEDVSYKFSIEFVTFSTMEMCGIPKRSIRNR